MFTGVSKFKGRHEFNVDDKGRLSVPAKFREILKANNIELLTVTRWFDPCLVVFPPEPWSEFKDKLQSLPFGKKNARSLNRFFRGSAVDCTMNEQGRISIPANLLKAVQIEKEAVIIGMGKYLEIWDKRALEKGEPEEFLDNLEGLEI